jgi:type 1 glutamine amidotransferase
MYFMSTTEGTTMTKVRKTATVTFSQKEGRRIFNVRFAVIWGEVLGNGDVVYDDQAETASDLANEIPGVNVVEGFENLKGWECDKNGNVL